MGQALGRATAPAPTSSPLLPAQLPEDLRCRLLASLPSDESGLRDLGFEDCVDHPRVPEHRYMEGFFHAVRGEHGRAVRSVNPRYGVELLRQPAPLPLAAFCEGLRRANAPLFADVARRLARRQGGAPVAEAVNSGRHLADLSVQVHWGDAVPPQHAAWHIDAANSYLHLAIGLQGRRALHRREYCRGPSAEPSEPQVLWQEPGAAYLSCPCTFPHAVEYPKAAWEDRVVAVQCRLLLSEDELILRREPIDTDPHGGVAASVFQALAVHGPLSLPSLEELEALEAELAAAQ